MTASVRKEIAGHEVLLSHAERVVFPAVGITKAELFEYYLTVGSALMGALGRRPTTLERWPRGLVDAGSGSTHFYQKHLPPGRPEWVGQCTVTFPSGRTGVQLCPESLADIAWAVNLGTVTFHPWPVRSAHPHVPDELRVDLDPADGLGFVDCVAVAQLARAWFADFGARPLVKTSGSRGIHVVLPIDPQWSFVQVRHGAIALARELENRRPDLVTSSWWKEGRGPRVFVDYNQNARDRVTAGAYCVRATPTATVSCPLEWDELPTCRPQELTVRTVPDRLAEQGDLWTRPEDLTPENRAMSALVDLYTESEQALECAEMPYPPDYPKMPGEPPRVPPSRARETPSANG